MKLEKSNPTEGKNLYPTTIARGIQAAKELAPEKIAVRHGARQASYRELVERISMAALAAACDPAVTLGEHVAIVANNCIEFIEVACGLPEAGIPVATVSPRLTAREIVAICDDAEARILFVDSVVATELEGSNFETVERIIEFGRPYEEWITSGVDGTPLPDIAETDNWTIPYTSGTMGLPKGVLIPHRSRVLTCVNAAVEYGCFSSSDRFLAFAPMSHGAGIIFALTPLFFGGFVEILERFEPELVLRKLKKGRFTGVFMVPTHFFGLFGLDQTVLDANKPLALRTIISNAAPLPQTTKEKIVAYFGEGLLHESYGSTEGGIVLNLRPEDQLRKINCVGKEFPLTSIKILNARGEICGENEIGELFSKSPYLFNGYWRKAEETANAMQGEWLTVGDLAKMDAEGYVYIVDRKKDMIISGGMNIYPREIEELLLAHPDISDAAVIGVPDEKWGERLKAYIVSPSSGIADGRQLENYLSSSLAGYKIPREYERINAIPRNAAGKIVKNVLRARNGGASNGDT